MPRTVALIHTTPATLDSAKQILARLAPTLTVRNYMDDSLLPQINAEGCISESVAYRFFSLLQGAALAQPEAVMCMCSSVGSLVERAEASLRIPCLRVDAPMARKAAQHGGKVTVVATVRSTLSPTLDLIAREAAKSPAPLTLESHLIEGAGPLLLAGDIAGYDALLAERLQVLCEHADLLVLAQASMARAAATLPAVCRSKCVTSLESGLSWLVSYVSPLDA